MKINFGKLFEKKPRVEETSAPLTLPKDSPFVLSEDGKAVFFGRYPQSFFENSSAISSSPNKQGFYTIIGDGANVMPLDVKKDCSVGGKRIAAGERAFFKFEPILWKILKYQNGEAFLLSEKILDVKPFTDLESTKSDNKKDRHGYEVRLACVDQGSIPANNWEVSTLREWLNWDFKYVCFNEEEAEHVISMPRGASLEQGETYSDDISLLTIEEASDAKNGFLGANVADEKRIAFPTDYARASGLEVDRDDKGVWWLASAGFTTYNAARVFYDGYLNETGKKTDNAFGVRPIVKVRF